MTNTLSPYAAAFIGEQWGHGEDQNTAAQMVAHAILGATLAYVNGGNSGAGASAAVASEAAAEYLTNQYRDNPLYQDASGVFQANLLPEDVKAQIRDLTAGIGAVIGGAVGDSTYNAQLAGVIGKNAVENNELFKVNDKGEFIACFEVFGLSCAPRQGERVATEQDIRDGAINIAIDVAIGTVIGRAVKVVKNGYQIADKVFKSVKDANKAIDNSALSSVQKQQLKEQLAQQAGIPRDIVNNPASLWGKTVDQIKQSFEIDGATLKRVNPRSSSSGNAIIYDIENSASGIKRIQHSPSTLGKDKQSTHGGEYYKITYTNGSQVKIIDTNNYKLSFDKQGKPLYDKNTTYMNSNGNVIKFDTTSNKWNSVK